jgi:hypothetical protein
MRRDSLVEEVRRIREAQAAQFGFDIRKIVEEIKKKERASGRKLVTAPPRPKGKFRRAAKFAARTQ